VSFVSVDVETTGLDPRGDAIVEIGAVKVCNGVVLGEFDTLVMIDRTIPLAARRVSGISNDMLVGKPRIGEALRRLWEFAGEDVLVEHSHKAFDIAFLEYAQGSPIVVPCINTCTLSQTLSVYAQAQPGGMLPASWHQE
jgi:DNA polymerase III epsilon subunit-like protein